MPWPVLVLAGLVLAIIVRTLLVQIFWIPSSSMAPTLVRGDRVLVNETAYWLGEPSRGDVIVFSDPRPERPGERSPIGALLRWLGRGLGVAAPDQEDLIKRVIATPGETWEIREGVVYVNGRPIDEPYLSPLKDDRSFGPETVPDGELFVLGDNRTRSEDSRFSAIGYVPVENVVGRAVAVVWPISEMRWL